MLGFLMDVFTIEAKRRLGLGVIVKSWIDIKMAVYVAFLILLLFVMFFAWMSLHTPSQPDALHQHKFKIFYYFVTKQEDHTVIIKYLV